MVCRPERRRGYIRDMIYSKKGKLDEAKYLHGNAKAAQDAAIICTVYKITNENKKQST